MKALQITQALKDANTRLDAIGVIQIFNSIPKTFSSLNYKIGQRTDGYNKLSNTVHEADGVLGFDRAMALIERRFINGVITGAQAKAFSEGIYPEIEPLYKGMWRLVKFNLDNATPPVNQDLLNIFNIIKTNVDNYVTANY